MMRDPKMILVIEEERQAAVLENDRLRAELADAKTALRILEGINTMRHELTDPGAQERRMERIADRMRADEHKETLGMELSKALASKLEAVNVELDKMGVLLADKHNTISALRAELADAKAIARYETDCVEAAKEHITKLDAELAAKHARIAALTMVLNRLANGSRFPSDETLRVVHKITTEVLGEAYEPFDIKMP